MGTTMPNDVSAIIAGAKRPERTLELCLRADLVADLEDAQRRLRVEKDRPRESLADGGNVDELKAEVERIKADARQHTIVFRFRALNRFQMQQMMAKYPPRDGNDLDKRMGYNVDAVTYWMVRDCCYEPGLSDAEWDTLLGAEDEVGNGVLSPAQWQRLDNVVSELNFARTDVPF